MEERTERHDRPTTATPTGERPPRRIAPPPKPKRRRGAPASDPIADLLTRLRNGARARHDVVTMPTSRMKVEIAKILKSEGFISSYDVSGYTLTCRLKYVGGGKISALTGIARTSRPGRRVYAGRGELPVVRRGLGVTIVTTSRGVMSGAQASRAGLGGEVLATVW